ncbi:MAG: acyltransferase [Micropruina sp.]|nr:acyltransferase [Micropruina sp.]
MSFPRRAVIATESAPVRRADIQGLRAVAVLAVIAFHVTGGPAAGFLGVDVFFVVSGFVITGVLLRRGEATNRIELGAFYLRRLRRILPLALTVILATVLAAQALLAEEKAASIMTDGLWAALFAGNWRFATTQTDYFALGSQPSPLQHFWSLGVEEQFYLGWPVAVAVVAWALVRAGVGLRQVMLGLAGVVVAGSLGWGWWQASQEPVTAYYSSFTRGWEIGLGCLLATLGVPRLSAAARTVLSWLGLVGIMLGLFWTPGSVGLPVPGAVGVCLGTGLVLVAGHGEQPRASFLLTNPVSGYLGDLSYGLYLWHFPVLVLAGAALGSSGGITALVIGSTVVLAVISHYLIERPFLSRPRPRSMLAALAALIASVLVFSLSATRGWLPADATILPPEVVVTEPTPSPTSPTTPSSPTARPSLSASAPVVVPLGSTGTAIQDGLRGGLALTRWPSTLSPPANNVGFGNNPAADISECAATKPDNPESCTAGNRKGPEIVVYGDSLGINLLAVVVEAYGDTHKVRGLTKLACAVNGAKADFGRPEWATPCTQHRQRVVAYVKKHKPRTLIMTQNYAWSLKLLSGAKGSAREKEWTATDQAFVDSIKDYVRNVVIVSPSLPGVGFFDCYVKGGSPQCCTTGVPAFWRSTQAAEKRVRDVTFVDTLHWYCVNGRCPMVSTLEGKTTLMKVDYLHVTYQYDVLLARDLRFRLKAAGVQA